MNERKNLSIVLVAGLASALAISAIGGSVAGNSPSMSGARSLGATEIAYETDGLLLSGESEEGRGEESEGGEGRESGEGEGVCQSQIKGQGG